MKTTARQTLWEAVTFNAAIVPNYRLIDAPPKGRANGWKAATMFLLSRSVEKFSRDFFPTVGLFVLQCGTFEENSLENFSTLSHTAFADGRRKRWKSLAVSAKVPTFAPDKYI